MKRRIISLMLAAVMALALLCACSSASADSDTAEAETPDLEKGWYAVIDEDGETAGYLHSTGRKVTSYDAEGGEILEESRYTWSEDSELFLIGGEKGFSLETEKKNVIMTIPKNSVLGFDKGSYTLEAIDEADMPQPGAAPAEPENGEMPTDPQNTTGGDTPAAPEAQETAGRVQASRDAVAGSSFYADEAFIYSGSEKIYVQYADGRLQSIQVGSDYVTCCVGSGILYYVDQNNDVVAYDLKSAEYETICHLQSVDDKYLVELIGIGNGCIYIGTQDSEEDWFGVEVWVYGEDGTAKEELGKYWDPFMKDGIFVLQGYRSDVSPQELYAIDTLENAVIADLGDDRTWGTDVIDGAIYYARVPEQEGAAAYTVSVCRADTEGTEVLLEKDVSEEEAYDILCFISDGFFCFRNVNESVADYYSLRTFDEIVVPGVDMSMIENFGVDDSGNYYFTVGETLYRENVYGNPEATVTLPDDCWVWGVTDNYLVCCSFNGDGEEYALYPLD